MAGALVNLPDVTVAQVNCEAMAVGPARTDCYIGLARINRQRAIIATDVAKQSGRAATLKRLTGVSAPKREARSKAILRH
jgi:hypothetical protein